MAEATKVSERPTSPHLTIYRRSINMMMSGLHRLTGAALYFGTLLLAAWLLAAATGPAEFALVSAFFAHPIGKLILFGYTWALLHHMLGGIRHLIWDSGRGFALTTVDLLCWMSIIGSAGLTALLWGFAKMQGMW